MDRQASPLLGHDFSQWSRLTERYAEEVEGLRRQEPGASLRLMRIAHAMKHQDLWRAGMPDSEHMALPARLAPPRPPRTRGATWRGRMRKTLFKLREHFRSRSAQDAHRTPEGAAPPMA